MEGEILRDYYQLVRLSQEQRKPLETYGQLQETRRGSETGLTTCPVSVPVPFNSHNTVALQLNDNCNMFHENSDSDSASTSETESLLHYLLDTEAASCRELMRTAHALASIESAHSATHTRACAIDAGHTCTTTSQHTWHANCLDYDTCENNFVVQCEKQETNLEKKYEKIVSANNIACNLDGCKLITREYSSFDVCVNKKLDLLDKVALLDSIGKRQSDLDMEHSDTVELCQREQVKTQEVRIIQSCEFGTETVTSGQNGELNQTLDFHPQTVKQEQQIGGAQKIETSQLGSIDHIEIETSQLGSIDHIEIVTFTDDDRVCKIHMKNVESDIVNETVVESEVVIGQLPANEMSGKCVGLSAECVDKSLDLIKSGLDLIKENLQSEHFNESTKQTNAVNIENNINIGKEKPQIGTLNADDMQHRTENNPNDLNVELESLQNENAIVQSKELDITENMEPEVAEIIHSNGNATDTNGDNTGKDTTTNPEISSTTSCQADDFVIKQFGCHCYALTSQSSVFEDDCNNSWQHDFDKSMFTSFSTVNERTGEVYISIPSSCINALLALEHDMCDRLSDTASIADSRRQAESVPSTLSQRSKSADSLVSSDETFHSAECCRTAEYATRLKGITAKMSKLSTEGHGDNNSDHTARLHSSQHKDKLIAQLREEMTSYKTRLEKKQEQIKQLCSTKEDAVWRVVHETEDENGLLRHELNELRESQLKLSQDLHTQTLILNKLKKQVEKQNQYNQEMYLKMYEKGKNAAWIERQEQLEELIEQSPSQVAAPELIQKLKHTEQELTRWQTLVRRESYEDGEHLKPHTESDATLSFMKDSMFHYLTNPDNTALHLRAMIRMLGFTDDEKSKIAAARKKVKSK